MNEVRRLRLLIVSHLFPKASNHAAGVFITRQAEFLKKHGVDSSFLVPRKVTAWPLTLIPRWRKYDLKQDPLTGPAEFPVRSASFFSLPGAWSVPYTTRRWADAAARVGCEWHREEPFDVVMGVDMTANAWAATQIGTSCEIPIASIAIGSDIMLRLTDSSILMNQLLRFLPDIDLPMGVSKMICTRMEDLGCCKRSPMVMYLPRDTKLFYSVEDKVPLRRKLGLDERRVVALYCGNLISVKGIAELIDAMRLLHDRRVPLQLVCIGDGAFSADLKNLESELGDRTIILPGRVKPTHVAEYLQASDFMVLPSRSEGMPQAVLEAMNCGLPIVGTRVGGIPEAVVDGETGLLVDPRSAAMLSAAMERMATDDSFRIAAGQRSLRRAQSVFDPDANTQKVAEALKALSR